MPTQTNAAATATVAPAILKNDFQSVFLIKNEPRAYAFGSFDFCILIKGKLSFVLYEFIFFEQSDKLSQSLIEWLSGRAKMRLYRLADF